jgi:hypothetical protein
MKLTRLSRDVSDIGLRFMPLRFYFGVDYTRFTAMCSRGGNEIHVNSRSPIRNEVLGVMNSIGGIWWTSFKSSNIKVRNLCLKCGMSPHSERVINGELNNIYRGFYGFYR